MQDQGIGSASVFDCSFHRPTTQRTHPKPPKRLSSWQLYTKAIGKRVGGVA